MIKQGVDTGEITNKVLYHRNKRTKYVKSPSVYSFGNCKYCNHGLIPAPPNGCGWCVRYTLVIKEWAL